MSYVGAWDAIREIFATAPLSRSAAAPGRQVQLQLGRRALPHLRRLGLRACGDAVPVGRLYLRCPDCDGRRYRPEILEVRIERGGRTMSVADVLELTVHEAAQLFAKDREVIRALQPIVDVGLEYVRLGQPVPTLSGGEAQRLKLAGFLAEAARASQVAPAAGAQGHAVLFDSPPPACISTTSPS